MSIPGQPLKLRDGAQPQQSRVQDNLTALLTPISTALGATPILGAAPPAWISLDVASALVSFVAGSSFLRPSYHVDALRYCHHKGNLTDAGAGTPQGTVLFRLPQEIWPAYTGYYPAWSGGGAALPWSAFIITPGGVVTNAGALGAGGTYSWDFEYRLGS